MDKKTKRTGEQRLSTIDHKIGKNEMKKILQRKRKMSDKERFGK